MWIVSGAGEDGPCGRGTGPGTLRATKKGGIKLAKAGTAQSKQPASAKRETTMAIAETEGMDRKVVTCHKRQACQGLWS
jgi:hypothetical protein